MSKLYQWFVNHIGDYPHPYTETDVFLFWLVVAMAVFFIVLIIWGLYSGADHISGKWIEGTGKIVDKLYKPSTYRSGVGMGMSTNGSPVVVSTSSGSSEEWFFMVDVGEGEIEKVFCSDDFYYQKSIGDRIDFMYRRGGISHKVVSSYKSMEA